MQSNANVELTASVKKTGAHWRNIIVASFFHLGAMAALFFWSWPAILTAVLLYWVAISLGVGMGYHRLLTHRSYRVPKPFEYFLTICGTLALQDGAINWVATHRIHHSHTDALGDPHSPRDGGWWSHIGWLVKGTAQQHEEAVLARYAPDLMKDRFHVWLNRLSFVPQVVLGLALLIFGGWGMMMWGIFLRVTVGLHTTWLVNSATHLWGRQRFQTGEDSRNSWWVALLTFGEGWHNNHHAHPTSARHGFAWYEIDFNWWSIRLLQFLRLAKSIKHVRLSSVSTALEFHSVDVPSKETYERA